MFFSVIIPLYNRPGELRELLDSLTKQSYKQFEVLVIEDGSVDKADGVVAGFADKLNIRYFFKENSGQGFTRNYGFEHATGDYFVIFDSDALIPPHYFKTVNERLAQAPVLDAMVARMLPIPILRPSRKPSAML